MPQRVETQPVPETTCVTNVTTTEPARGDTYLSSLALFAALALALAAFCLVVVQRGDQGGTSDPTTLEARAPTLDGVDPRGLDRSSRAVAARSGLVRPY